MFDGINLTLISDVNQDKKMFGSDKRSLINVSSRCTYKIYQINNLENQILQK